MKLKKGSPEAKRFMAKLRAAKGKSKPKAKKVIAKKVGEIKSIGFENSNLYLNGFGIDTNGNSVVKISYPNSRAFSIQTNGVLKETNNLYTKNINKLSAKELNIIENEVINYISSYGSKEQKTKLRSYKKVGAYKKPTLFKPSKTQTTDAAKRLVKQAMHKDTKSHNVNIKIVSGMNKSKETQFYEIVKDNNLAEYLTTFGKTYGKFTANIKTIISTGKKTISPKAIQFYKKIENLPLKFTSKTIGKKSKHYEYIDGKNQDTYHQLTEYKISI